MNRNENLSNASVFSESKSGYLRLSKKTIMVITALFFGLIGVIFIALSAWFTMLFGVIAPVFFVLSLILIVNTQHDRFVRSTFYLLLSCPAP